MSAFTFAGSPVIEAFPGVLRAIVAVVLALEEFVPDGVVGRVLPVIEDNPEFIAAALGGEFDDAADLFAPSAGCWVNLHSCLWIVDNEVIPGV